MSSQPVFADAFSRLHADIAITRLIRAGIRPERISAIFPRGRAPNSVCCWLKNLMSIRLASEWPLAAAGRLGLLVGRTTSAASVERKLETLGLSPTTSHRVLEKIQSGMIVICVHPRSAAEAERAHAVFARVGAEDISYGAPATAPDSSIPTGEFAGVPA